MTSCLHRRPRLGQSGATAAEFALTLPIAMMLITCFVQVGSLFFANAGLQGAVSEAARVATLWPRKNDSQIRAELNPAAWGLNPTQWQAPTFVRGTASGQDFVDITVSYQANMNFILFTVPAVTLSHSRRAYLP